MKKLIILVAVVFTALHLNMVSAAGKTEENKLVEDLLKEMIKEESSRGNLHRFIAPSFYKKHSINVKDYNVNTYYPKTYVLNENQGDGMVKATIYGEGKSWKNALLFKVVTEGGKLYLYPGRAPSEYFYIDPWFQVLKDTETEVVITNDKDAENDLVDRILSDMVDRNDAFGTSARKYIAPSYYKSNSLKKEVYSINSYSPVGYSIESNNGNGNVIAKIWGDDRSWVHQLTFKIVKENGMLYSMPGGHTDNSYIHPWLEVETDVESVEEEVVAPSTTSIYDENELIDKVLYDMVNNNSDFGTRARKYMAPSYYAKNKLDKYDYEVNHYTPSGYEIVRNNGTGIVVTRIWGEDKSWIHELNFKVVKESGLLYVMPSGHTDNNYVHPWWEITTDVTDTKKTTVKEKPSKPVKGEESELVDKILDKMVYGKSTFGDDMRLYIAPSYFKNNSLDPYDYQVNSYTPKGYSIESVKGNGMVVAKIWGEDRGWVHELTFKLVKENGLLYVMPGEHDPGTSYVDPWYSVKTYVE